MMQKNNFVGYIVHIDPHAKREFKKLEKNIVAKVYEKLRELVQPSHNLDIKKLTGHSGTYRLSFGDYRVIFEAKKHEITILVISVGHRKEVYRDY